MHSFRYQLIFKDKIFVGASKTTKSMKSLVLKSFRLNSIVMQHWGNQHFSGQAIDITIVLF